MKYVVGIIIAAALFFVGSVIGNPWINKRPAQQGVQVNKAATEPQIQDSEPMQKLAQERDKAIADKKVLEETIAQYEKTSAQTKSDYEARLMESKKALWEEKIKNLGRKDTSTEMGTSKPKNDMISNAVKMQIGKIYRDRIKNLDKKSALSDEAKAKLEALNDEQTAKITEMTMKMLAGDISMEDLNKEDMDVGYEQKIKDILTPEQNAAFQEIIKEEKELQIKQAVALYMNGAGQMKGIAESVSLTDEQSKKVKEIYSDLLHNPVTGTDKANSSVLPFENRDLNTKIRGVLTQEQLSLFEEYLKEQAEFYESVNLFRSKKDKPPK